MEKKLETGDEVVLKSNPEVKMTLGELWSGGQYYCYWFDAKGDNKKQVFPKICLMRPPEPPIVPSL